LRLSGFCIILHVDGFRYDYVPGFWDGPIGVGYANLVFRTYEMAQDFAQFPRFDAGDGGRSLIVQCAENLPDPRGVLSSTYSNTCWQNELFDLAREQLKSPTALTAFAHQLDPEFVGYPSEYRNPATGDTLPVAPFQYVESHDHSRFVAEFGVEPFTDLVWEPYGDRSRWAKTQPYAIALYTVKGVPMLWQGQEFAENWTIPDGTDPRRTLFSRPLHWEYFYDDAGKALVRLYRRLGDLRHGHRALGSRGDIYYFDDENHRRDGLLAYRRQAAGESLVVILNFSDADRDAWIPWPLAGTWNEQIDRRSSLRDREKPGEAVRVDQFRRCGGSRRSVALVTAARPGLV
jgi:1,4-alpha-glucan branching enzyme